MSAKTTSRWRAALSTHLFTDAVRGTTLAGIQKVGPQSPLIQIPSVAASFAALASKGAALATKVDEVAANEQQLVQSMTERDSARLVFDLELITLKTLTENNAKSGADLTGMGFSIFSAVKASQTLPDPPWALVVKHGRAHGKASVSVPADGHRYHYAAEATTDPVGVWWSLPGNGRQRKLAGPTGTRVWVRFATVRFGMQSAWSVPVLVTFP